MPIKLEALFYGDIVTTLKSAAEQERQKLFEKLRHYFGSRHQAPADLNSGDLHAILKILSGESYEIY